MTDPDNSQTGYYTLELLDAAMQVARILELIENGHITCAPHHQQLLDDAHHILMTATPTPPQLENP